jgi:hypothetical protein
VHAKNNLLRALNGTNAVINEHFHASGQEFYLEEIDIASNPHFESSQAIQTHTMVSRECTTVSPASNHILFRI